MIPVEIIDSIPDFKTFRVWNATRKCWVSKRYTRKGDAISYCAKRNNKNSPYILVLVTTSSYEVKYELI